MSDYDSITVSNYFRVNNEEAFRELIKKTKTDWKEINISESHGDGSRYRISCLGSITGICESSQDCSNCVYDRCEPDYDAFVASLMELLPDGEAVIISTAGHEKMDYIVGSVSVITNTHYESASLGSVGLEIARKIFQDPNWKTYNDSK